MSENVLYLSVELELKIISSTGCTILLSGDHEFPARAKLLIIVEKSINLFRFFHFIVML